MVHAAVIFVNITPSPEAKFPLALEEAYSATKYIAENGSIMNLDHQELQLQVTVLVETWQQ